MVRRGRTLQIFPMAIPPMRGMRALVFTVGLEYHG